MPHHLSHQGSPLCCLYDRKPTLGISLMVQWLIPCSQCKGPRFNPRELRYLMLQLSSRKLQIRPSAAKYIKKKNKRTNIKPPVLSGNRAPVKHLDLIAVNSLLTGSQRETLKIQLRCLSGKLLGKFWVILHPAVPGLRKEEV